MRYAYPVHLEPNDRGVFVASFPDMPEAITEGDTRKEAMAEAVDARAVAMGAHVEDHRPVPVASSVRAGQDVVALPTLIAAKVALYGAMRDQGVTNVALAQQLGVSGTVVRRLTHPDQQSRIERVEQALAALGKHLLVEAA